MTNPIETSARGPRQTYMVWLKRSVAASPFVLAAFLTVLNLGVDRFHLHREHVAGYAFLFGAPWAWLLDRGWTFTHPRWLCEIWAFFVVLWIPALLYSACLWLLFEGLRRLAARHSRR